MAHYRSVQDWWPLPPQEAASSVTKPRLAGLFVRGCLRKRRERKKLEGKAGPKAKAKKASAKKAAKKESKKESKKGKKGLKKAPKEKTPVAEVLKNYRRQGVGVTLVLQQMEKAFHLDKLKKPDNPLFTEAGECRLKISSCSGRPWEEILKLAHPFLKTVPLVCR